MLPNVTPTHSLAKEVEYTINQLVKEFDRTRLLAYKQKLLLFRSLVTYMHSCLNPPMLEKSITSITLHAVVQAIIEHREEKEPVSLSVEPCEGGLFETTIQV